MLDKNNLNNLSMKQRELDLYILQNNKLRSNSDITKKKLMAFWVELGEYANEERSFKYWSQKPSSSLDRQLDEFIDGLHFLLSLGNDFNYDFNLFNFSLPKAQNILDQYFVTFDYFHQLIKIIDNCGDSKLLWQTYDNLCNAYCGLGYLANYSTEAILSAYDKKHLINFQRQNNHY